MTNENEKRINEKCDFFYSEKIEVHIKKVGREFLNGILKEKLRDGVWLLNERKLGDVYLFEKDIYEIEQLEKKEEDVE